MHLLSDSEMIDPSGDEAWGQCAAAARLLASYHDALTIVQLCEAPSFMAAPGDAAAAAAARDAFLQARRNYWEHIQEHGCRSLKKNNAVKLCC